jgi:hypothetical protein
MEDIYIFIEEGMQKIVIEYGISIKKKLNAQLILDNNNQNIIMKNFNNLSKYIFLGIKYTNYNIINSTNVYFVNLEPLTCNGNYSKYNFLQEVLNFHNNYNLIKLLDYSEENALILKSYNIQSKYLPYQVNLDEIKNYAKNDYDVVTCLSWSNRIEYIYKNIPLMYKKYSIGNPVLWDNDRDNILFKSKILINIHHRENDYKILQEIRLTRCILNKIIIISEESICPNVYPLSKYIIFVEYNNIIDKIIDVLNNYDKYYNEIYSNFDLCEIDDILSKYIKHINI